MEKITWERDNRGRQKKKINWKIIGRERRRREREKRGEGKKNNNQFK